MRHDALGGRSSECMYRLRCERVVSASATTRSMDDGMQYSAVDQPEWSRSENSEKLNSLQCTRTSERTPRLALKNQSVSGGAAPDVGVFPTHTGSYEVRADTAAAMHVAHAPSMFRGTKPLTGFRTRANNHQALCWYVRTASIAFTIFEKRLSRGPPSHDAAGARGKNQPAQSPPQTSSHASRAWQEEASSQQRRRVVWSRQ
jgi:hypothetical protein